ncbi:heat shock protein HspQ [Pokkaliibacter sp. CJK22405]|uniref:heat shock protein HspQ n=1 Tax=Pokkaliibacter sp. CJK22405 TaxID=3384615 RepID=UPI003984D306
MQYREAKYAIGQIVEHRYLGYRGVIVDVDYAYAMDSSVLEQVNSALNNEGRPALDSDQPFYLILSDDTSDHLYISEVNLKDHDDFIDVDHDEIPHYLDKTKGLYKPRFFLH